MASVLKKLLNKGEEEDKKKTAAADSGDISSSDQEESKDKAGSKEDSVASDAGEEIQIDPEEDLRAFKDPDPASKEWKNRQRTLVVCSRGIAGRMRHLV